VQLEKLSLGLSQILDENFVGNVTSVSALRIAAHLSAAVSVSDPLRPKISHFLLQTSKHLVGTLRSVSASDPVKSRIRRSRFVPRIGIRIGSL